jgi:ammonia channel protein AmtB
MRPAPGVRLHRALSKQRAPDSLAHAIALACAGIGWLLAIAGTLVLLFLVDHALGLRMSPVDEAAGMDLSLHGEEGYELNA